MIFSRVVLTLFCVGLGLSACDIGSQSQASGGGTGDGLEGPLPTIGLGSETGAGRINGGIDLRPIDAGEIESLVMIGDSITVGATPALQANFTALGFDDVSIVAQQDKRIAVTSGNNSSGLEIARFVAGAAESEGESPMATLWIVALGTNDIGQYDGVDQVIEVVDRVLDTIPRDAPLIWVNTYFASRPEATAEVNEAIELRIRERGNATVGRWNQVAPSDGVLRSDGVHPNDDGAEVFAALVANTVADFLQ